MIEFNPFPKIQGGFLGKEVSDLNFLILEQVHGDQVVFYLTGMSRDLFVGDAWMTRDKNAAIAIRTADCVPILIAHPENLIAAVHAGWRGTQQQILSKVLNQIKRDYALDLSQIKMMIGPAICGNCYEVGEEVASQFASHFIKKSTSADKYFLDLKHANAEQAMKAGLAEKQIEISSVCTLCEENIFYSYRGAQKRGEEKGGRNIAFLKMIE